MTVTLRARYPRGLAPFAGSLRAPDTVSLDRSARPNPSARRRTGGGGDDDHFRHHDGRVDIGAVEARDLVRAGQRAPCQAVAGLGHVRERDGRDNGESNRGETDNLGEHGFGLSVSAVTRTRAREAPQIRGIGLDDVGFARAPRVTVLVTSNQVDSAAGTERGKVGRHLANLSAQVVANFVRLSVSEGAPIGQRVARKLRTLRIRYRLSGDHGRGLSVSDAIEGSQQDYTVPSHDTARSRGAYSDGPSILLLRSLRLRGYWVTCLQRRVAL